MVTPAQIPEWLRELYPFNPKTHITSGGARMSYIDEGSSEAGDAIVFVHGNPTWSFFFRKPIRELTCSVRCIAPDHIGMGLSEKPEDYDYRLETRIADLSSLIESLGLKKVHLVMHDWGGAIGSGWAVRNPEKVLKLVYLNTAAFRSSRIPWRIRLCRTGVPGTFIVRGLNGFAGPATWMAMKSRRLSREERKAYLLPYGNWEDRVAVDAFVKDIPMEVAHPSWETLKRIEEGLVQFAEKEVCLVWGGKDFCFNRSFFDEFKRRFPKAKTHYLEEAGHYVLEDAPEEALAAIKTFLGD